MSGIPEVPEAERTCRNCQLHDGNKYKPSCKACYGHTEWRESLASLRARAGAIIAELQAAVNGLAHTCDHLEDDRDYNAGLVATLTKERDEIGKQWHVMAGRIAHICQLLGVDFCCEEPETCEQVIERRSGELAAMRDLLVQIQEEAGRYIRVPQNNRAAPHRIHTMVGRMLASDAGKPEADVIRAARAVWKEWRARPGDALYPDRVLFCKLGQALECLDGKGGGS